MKPFGVFFFSFLSLSFHYRHLVCLCSIYRKSRWYTHIHKQTKHIVGDHPAIMQCNVPFSIFESMWWNWCQCRSRSKHPRALNISTLWQSFIFAFVDMANSYIFRSIDTSKTFYVFCGSSNCIRQMFSSLRLHPLHIPTEMALNGTKMRIFTGCAHNNLIASINNVNENASGFIINKPFEIDLIRKYVASPFNWVNL